MDTLPLDIPETPELTTINRRCWLRDADGLRTVLVSGVPLFVYDRADKLAERYAVAWLFRSGLARQHALAKGFGYEQKTVSSWHKRFEKEGLAGLIDRRGRHPRSHLLDGAIRRLHAQGLSNVRIGQIVHISEAGVRSALQRLGLTGNFSGDCLRQPSLALEAGATEDGAEGHAETSDLAVEQHVQSSSEAGDAGPNDSLPLTVPEGAAADWGPLEVGAIDDGGDRGAETSDIVVEQHVQSSFEAADAGLDDSLPLTVPEGVTADQDPLDRSCDRVLAAVGLLQDAMPLFADGERLPHAGVLLAVPFIVSCGLLNSFVAIYRRLGPAFYGLRTTVMTLLFLALLRIRRIENLKDVSAEDLGRPLGLDRIAEPKTLRRKLSELAARGLGAALMGKVADQRLKRINECLLGVLYIDGHVREYFGKHSVSSTHVPRRNRAGKAATDIWVNDAFGDPIFVVCSELNEALTLKLEEVLAEIQRLLGPDRPLTVVFDRGGWNLKLFGRLLAQGVHFMTYRKGPSPEPAVEGFREVCAEIQDKTLHYRVHEMSVQLGEELLTWPDGGERPLWLRQITRLRDDGRRAEVLTTRQDLPAAVVIWSTFNRWRQENFFKYMRTELALDAMVGYGAEPVSEGLDCPNPARREIHKAIGALRQRHAKLAAQLGRETATADAPWWRSLSVFRSGRDVTVEQMKQLDAQIENLCIARMEMPKRVPATTVYERLPHEKKLICDAVKLTAYQIESDMLRVLDPHYARADDEGRKLLVAAFKSPADLHVAPGELLVTLTPMSSAHRTKALAALCEDLNRMQAVFPGTDLTMRYDVHPNR